MDKTEKLTKLMDRLWAASMAVTGAVSLVLTITGLAGITLPTWLMRSLGVLNLIALPVLIYATVKKYTLDKKKQPETRSVPGRKKPKKKKRK